MASANLALKTRRFRQSEARCGPAALKIVAQYFGIELQEAALARICRTSSISGTAGINLVTAARKLGFAAKIVDGASLKMIAAWLRRGIPVIVDWMSTGHSEAGPSRVACGHYSVVCGLTPKEIILEDPAIGRKRRLPRHAFMSVWYDFKHLFPKKNDDPVIRRMVVIAPPALLQGSR
jgi:ABC-type bacteriocin/lantibiotic exporter with double-glycine peptidase domain